MTYEELEILIKNDEHRQLELKKTTGELKDGMHSACASYIERWGSGVKRITDACAYRNVETPTWTTDGYFVTVTFKRPDYNANVPINVPIDVTKDVPKDDTINDTKDDTKDCIKELSDRQYLIVRFITLNDTITIDEMIQKMKVSPITVKRDLADLQAKGIIAREGGRKNGRWVILKPLE